MRTAVPASDKKQNAQEVRRYDTNMRHNGRSTEGWGGRRSEAVSFFPPLPLASGEKRSRVISQTRNLLEPFGIFYFFLKPAQMGSAKEHPGLEKLNRKFCTAHTALGCFLFPSCSVNIDPPPTPQQKVAALITGMQEAAAEQEKESRKICGTI